MKKRKMKIGFCLVVGIAVSMLLISTAVFASPEWKSLVDTESKYTMQVWDDTDWVAMPWYKELSAAFEEMYPNIQVQPVGIPCSELGPKLLTALAAGSPPDLPRSLYRLSALSARGAFMDLTERTKYWPRKLDFVPWELGQHKGKQYAIPQAQMVVGIGYYWKADFEKAGLRFFEPDEWVDWDQLMEVIKKLKTTFSARRDYYPTAVASSWLHVGMGSILTENGARYWSEDYETPTWDSPEAIKAFEWYVNLYRKGYSLRPAPGVTSAGQVTKLFENRNVSVILSSDMMMPRYLAVDAPELVGDENWGCFMPVAPGKEPAGISWLYSSSISAGAPHPEAAWAWIELMCTNWGMSRILRDSKYFPTIRDFPLPKDSSKQIVEIYNAFQPYVTMTSSQLDNYKYSGVMGIVQEMIEKMFYTNEDIAAIAKEYKQKALEYIKESK